jgi:hypothetical protein
MVDTASSHEAGSRRRQHMVDGPRRVGGVVDNDWWRDICSEGSEVLEFNDSQLSLDIFKKTTNDRSSIHVNRTP